MRRPLVKFCTKYKSFILILLLSNFVDSLMQSTTESTYNLNLTVSEPPSFSVKRSNFDIKSFSNNSYYVPIINETLFDSKSISSNKLTHKSYIVEDVNRSELFEYDEKVPLIQISLKSNSPPPLLRIDNNAVNQSFEFKRNNRNDEKLQHFIQNSGGNINQNSTLKKLEIFSTDAKYNAQELAKTLQTRLKNIRNNELGVATIQEIFDAMDFVVQTHTDKENKLKEISNRLSKKIENSIYILKILHNFFLQNVTNFAVNNDSDNDDEVDDFEMPLVNNLFLNTLIFPCPFDDFSLQQNYNKHEIQVLNFLKNDDINQKFAVQNGNLEDAIKISNDVNQVVNAKIKEEFRKFNLEANHLKHLYFLSSNDHASDHQCQYYFNDINFRSLYISTIKRKHVFLLLDNGNAFNNEQFELLKLFVHNIIQMLSESDTVTIVLISKEATPMSLLTSDDELSETEGDNYYIYQTKFEQKQQIYRFIENLNFTTTLLTNHSRGFEYSFDLLKKQNLEQSRPLLFLYITRGLLQNLSDKAKVLATIAEGQSKLKVPVVINTCAVVLDERRIMYEKQFLRDIAQQNYTKYDLNVSKWYNYDLYNLTGSIYIITKRHPERIIKVSTAIFENLFLGKWRIDDSENLKYIEEKIKFHQPIYDYNTKDLIVPITQSVNYFGVIGLNLYLTDLAEDIIYYKNTENEYAFMIDINGKTIFHPAFSRPNVYQKNLYPVEIDLLENSKKFKDLIKKKLLTMDSGNEKFTNSKNITKIYSWERVQNTYIICVVSETKVNFSVVQNIKLQRNEMNNQQMEHILPLDLLYHRLDLVPPKNQLCRHFRQIATLETGTVFLSASAFESPFIYLKNNRENKEKIRTHTAQSIMAYIKDSTSLLANPGLLPRIRNDVAILYHVISYLKKKHLENCEYRKYIIRRYIATTTGVVQVYPGCILGTELEPSRRLWYRKAMKYPGKIIATEPYLDAGGAGYVVTIAHTIFEGKSSALHNAQTDTPAAVVAIDVPYGFFYRLVIDTFPTCLERNIKCLLIEDNAYLLGHPSFMEPSTSLHNYRRPKEHLTHKESFVANDILNHKQLVSKKICANYQNRTSERFYQFNTTTTETFTNVVHGDRTKYQITLVPGTNLFAAILNSTKDGGAFCPCSTVDRVCLNCNRMDQTDCECPCECPLKFQKNGELLMTIINRNYNDTNSITDTEGLTFDYCEPPTEGLEIVNSMSYDWNTVLKACININCDLYPTQNDCLGIMGCEWCQLDVDGNPFSNQFCTTQNSCFNGVLGSMTPYGDNDIGATVVESINQPVYSAIGPVGGAIIALCIVVGFAMYCYRQNLDTSADQLYPESIQEENFGLPLSRFNYDDCHGNNGLGDDDILGGGNGSHIMHKNLIHPLANSIAVSDISPYHMSTGGYRRPPNGESDNGYSTMTPHEDSDMCFTLVEPLINTNKRLSTSADSMSISTSISSPTNQAVETGIQKSTYPQQKRNKDYSSNSAKNYDKSSSSPTSSSGIGKDSPVPRTMKQISLEQTILPQQHSPHHILAPVTVHRHMEAS